MMSQRGAAGGQCRGLSHGRHFAGGMRNGEGRSASAKFLEAKLISVGARPAREEARESSAFLALEMVFASKLAPTTNAPWMCRVFYGPNTRFKNTCMSVHELRSAALS